MATTTKPAGDSPARPARKPHLVTDPATSGTIRTSKTQRDSAAAAKAVKAATPKAKPKTEPKVKVLAERVPAETVLALLKELGLSKSQLATATGKSPSLVSEWVGKGRGRLISRDQFAVVEQAARAFAKEGAK